VLIRAYLEEGPEKRGSLREAIELVGAKHKTLGLSVSRHPASRERPELGLGNSLKASDYGSGSEGDDLAMDETGELSEKHDGDKTSDDDDDDFTLEQSETGSSDGDHETAVDPFNPLKVEKLRRGLLRWRRDLEIEACSNLRVALTTALQRIPLLFDLLEPLADHWSFKLARSGAAQYDDQLLSSWTGELVGNLLCLYTGTVADLDSAVERLRGIPRHMAALEGAKLRNEDQMSVEGSLIRFTDLTSAPGRVTAVLLPAMAHLCSNSLMRAGATVFFCKPLLTTRANIETANRLLCGRTTVGTDTADETQRTYALCNDMCHDTTPQGEIQATSAIAGVEQRRCHIDMNDRAIVDALLGCGDNALLLAMAGGGVTQSFGELLGSRVSAAASMALLPSASQSQTDDDEYELEGSGSSNGGKLGDSFQQRMQANQGWQQSVEDSMQRAESRLQSFEQVRKRLRATTAWTINTDTKL